MWLEKLCKVHLWAIVAQQSQFRDLLKKHDVIEKVLPALVRQHWYDVGLPSEPRMDPIRKLCREIDLLHPQSDAGGKRPDNVEYPWSTSAGSRSPVIAPAEAGASLTKLAEKLMKHQGRQLMKAAIVLTRQPETWLTER